MDDGEQQKVDALRGALTEKACRRFDNDRGIQGHADACVAGLRKFRTGASIEEIMEWHYVTRGQIITVLELAARCLDAATPQGCGTPA